MKVNLLSKQHVVLRDADVFEDDDDDNDIVLSDTPVSLVTGATCAQALLNSRCIAPFN